ncbi:histone-fold-containing protein [Sanghuangporus baumii]|uniref:DNA polymerase epsilon subunit D n=1 Tax=Sanghuangporus baumii TaxID=108892 RepID=A0A9Q5I225_SANBA|nr:histone-fold-containing protein [Sanghuangporus baumii]
MPPAKKDPPTPAAVVQAQQDAASDGIDYYELPKALVQRIAKSSIPESSKLQKETVTALQKGSTVFINYLAATAHDIATSRQHKTVSASDVLKALEVIQFGDMVEPLQHELQSMSYRLSALTQSFHSNALQVFRENAKNPRKSSSSAHKSASAASGAGAGDSVSARSKPSSNLSPKAKGKERASEGGHGPSPLSTSVYAADVTAGDDIDMKDQEQVEESADEDEEDVVDEFEDELADDVDVDEDVGDEADEPEEVVDQMAVDEDELRQDVKKAGLVEVNGAK